VSVLITVHNREHLIGPAMASVLAQTVSDLELIVVDDGSTDGTVAAVDGIADPRVRLIRHPRNRGIPAGRNSALEAATGEFIAWLDSDDLARPRRLERQLNFLRANPDIAMIGSCAGKLRESGSPLGGVRVPPLTHHDIRAWLLFRSAFQQSSVFGRSDVLKAFPYREEFPVCEDVDMFVRVSSEHRVANLPEVLVDRRIHPGQTIRSNHEPIIAAQSTISARQLDWIGVVYDSEDLRRHVLLGGSFRHRPDAADLEWVQNWLDRLIAANRLSGAFDNGALRLCASFMWLRACARASSRTAAAAALATTPLTASILSGHGRTWLRKALPLMLAGKR
jgi:glycosyltransferase involved in cell wall biosynthesis